MSWPMTPTETFWVPALIFGPIIFGLGAFWQSKRGCSHCRKHDRHASIVQSAIELAESELAAGSARWMAAHKPVRVTLRSGRPAADNRVDARRARTF